MLYFVFNADVCLHPRLASFYCTNPKTPRRLSPYSWPTICAQGSLWRSCRFSHRTWRVDFAVSFVARATRCRSLWALTQCATQPFHHSSPSTRPGQPSNTRGFPGPALQRTYRRHRARLGCGNKHRLGYRCTSTSQMNVCVDQPRAIAAFWV